MTDYLTDHRTVQSKGHSISYTELNSDCEITGEKEINFLDYNDSWGVLNKHKLYSNKQKITKPLSDLGKALSETISKLTRDERFKCGDKVELILEIELVKSQTEKSSKVRPKHSIVEVTIIQHQVPPKTPVTKPMTGDRLSKRLPFRLLPNNSESETGSAKRRKWFERVIYNKTVRYDVQNDTNMRGDNKTNFSTIKYLNTKWCETNIDKTNYEMDRVHRVKQRRKLRNKGRQFQYEPLSKGFLPASKANKSKEVEKAFSELKEKVDHLIEGNKQNSNLSKKKGRIPSLGKLVSNILVGFIEKANSNMNSLKNSGRNTPVINRHGYNIHRRGQFCRIMNDDATKVHQNKITQILKPRNLRDMSKMELNIKSPRKETVLNQNEKQHDCGLTYRYDDMYTSKKLHGSYKHSVTKVKKKEQMNDNVVVNQTLQNKTEPKLQSTSSDQSWILKIEKKKKGKKNVDEIGINNQKVSILNSKKEKKTSDENWSFDGKSLKLGNELKRKIETLIVNELQNLALKEGMECDISPIVSENNLNYDLKNSVSEVQSFLCEIDLNDNLKCNTNIGEMKKGENNVINQKLCKEVTNTPRQCFDNEISVFTDDGKSNKLNTIDEQEEKKFEITYFNSAVESWSRESASISPRTVVLNQPKIINNISSSKKGFIKELNSDDTIWKNTNFVDKSDTNSSQLITETGPSKTSTANQISDTTNEYCSNIEIELDVKDLEHILEQARANSFNDKFLINATRNKKKRRKHKPHSINKSKNTSSYTDTVLSEAAKKLENHLKTKEKKRSKK